MAKHLSVSLNVSSSGCLIGDTDNKHCLRVGVYILMSTFPSADPENFVREGITLTTICFKVGVRPRCEDPNTEIKHFPNISIKWRFVGGPMMAQH